MHDFARLKARTNDLDPILAETETCWRVAVAGRVAVLVGAAAYYGVLREIFARAHKRILIIGWDIDGRAPLVCDPPEPADGRPKDLRGFLIATASERPDLDIRLLEWDYPAIYSLERDPVPTLTMGATTPDNMHFRLDSSAPTGGSHHQKLVVVDDSLAFCGGIDVAVRRWDVADHPPHHVGRIGPDGEPYPPFHDMQMMVDGACARALADLARDRWYNAVGEALDPLEAETDLWPDHIEPDFRDHPVGIARTWCGPEGSGAERENEALYHAAIASARETIYIENQYLAEPGIAESLAHALEANPELRVLLITSRAPRGPLEEKTMGALRERFMGRLAECGGADRVRVLYPAVMDGGDEIPVTVHAKLMIVDERFLRIGSANINRRSMGLDSECDLALEATDDGHRAVIAGIRNRLLAGHLGVDADQIRDACSHGASLFAAIDTLNGGEHSLRPVQPRPELANVNPSTILDIGDPDRPIIVEELVEETSAFPEKEEERGRPILRMAAAIALVLAVVGAILAWRFTPLSEFLDLGVVIEWIEHVRAARWTPAIVVGVYVALGLVAFPVTVLIAATAMVFGPWFGFLYALTGSLASASAGYAIGRFAGRPLVDRVAGRVANRVNEALTRHGIVTVASVRLLPIAPFLVVNLIAGASRLGPIDFLLGTVIGMAPGITVMAALGSSLGGLIESGNPEDVAILLAAIAAWIGFAFLVHRLLKRRMRRSA